MFPGATGGRTFPGPMSEGSNGGGLPIGSELIDDNMVDGELVDDNRVDFAILED